MSLSGVPDADPAAEADVAEGGVGGVGPGAGAPLLPRHAHWFRRFSLCGLTLIRFSMSHSLLL